MKIHQIGYYISNKNHTQTVTPKRRVMNTELEFYMTGGNISVINGEEFLQEKCNVLVAEKGDERYSIGSFECFAVHFSSEETRAVTDKLPNVFKVFDSDTVLKSFKAMLAAYEKGTAEGILLAKAKILELVSILSAEGVKNYEKKFLRYSENILNACRFMEENFDSHIALCDIAAVSALSPSFFHKIFKESIGKTPQEYLLELRLSHAKNLLKNTNYSLTDIAYQCGFEGQAYFGSVFRRHIKTTPKKYRDENRIIL